MFFWQIIWSRLTSSESQDQEEAAYACPADTSTSVLFTATNAMKFPSTVPWSSWALPIGYYRASIFLQCRHCKNILRSSIITNQ